MIKLHSFFSRKFIGLGITVMIYDNCICNPIFKNILLLDIKLGYWGIWFAIDKKVKI